MGNWRTVRVEGTCAPAEVQALKTALEYDDSTYENFHCLSYNAKRPSLCGLQGWAAPTFDAVGNMAERDYGVEDAAEQLRTIVKTVPSLRLKMHCGGEYESKDCINTITVTDGNVTVGPPEVTAVEFPEGQTMANFMKAIAR